MNPSLLRRVAALAAVAASTPLMTAMPGDAGQPEPIRLAHARRTDVPSAGAERTVPTTVDNDASEHWQTIELPRPSRLDLSYPGVARNTKVRT